MTIRHNPYTSVLKDEDMLYARIVPHVVPRQQTPPPSPRSINMTTRRNSRPLAMATPPHLRRTQRATAAPTRDMPVKVPERERMSGDETLYNLERFHAQYMSLGSAQISRWAPEPYIGTPGYNGMFRVRIGQGSYKWHPWAIAAIIQFCSGVRVLEAKAQLNPNGQSTGMFMIWVGSQEEADIVVACVNRSFLCDLEGVWFVPKDWNDDWLLDGYFRSKVAKALITAEVAHTFDPLWDSITVA